MDKETVYIDMLMQLKAYAVTIFSNVPLYRQTVADSATMRVTVNLINRFAEYSQNPVLEWQKIKSNYERLFADYKDTLVDRYQESVLLTARHIYETMIYIEKKSGIDNGKECYDA